MCFQTIKLRREMDRSPRTEVFWQETSEEELEEHQIELKMLYFIWLSVYYKSKWLYDCDYELLQYIWQWFYQVCNDFLRGNLKE